MQNKLVFADGLTWNYTWNRYHAEIGQSPHTSSFSWPAQTAIFLYVSSSITTAGPTLVTLSNVSKEDWGQSGESPLSGKYWFISSDKNLSGDITVDMSNVYSQVNYGGENIIYDTVHYEIDVVYSDLSPNCPYYDVVNDFAYVYNQNRSAYPEDGYANGYWYVLTGYPDNIEVTDEFLIGGVDYAYDINTENNITIGQSACARIEFYTQKLDKTFQGRTCTYYVKQDNDNNFRKIGVFYIAKAERINSYGKYKMIGYDNVFRLNTIIDDWLYHTSYDANRYKSWDSGLSTTNLTYIYSSGYDGNAHALTLCTDLGFDYNDQASTSANMWKFKVLADTDYITMVVQPTQVLIDEYQAWINSNKEKIIYVLEGTYHDADLYTGAYVNVEQLVYYKGTATLDWNSGYPHILFTQAQESWAPYDAKHNNTYFTEVSEFVTYNESGQIDYPINSCQLDGTEYLMYYRTYHRDPIVSNGRCAPTSIVSSICGELGLTYNFTSSMGPTYVYFGFTASGITATAMLSYLAEVCGGYLAADVDGNITVKTFGSISSVTSPNLDNTKYKTYTYQDEAVDVIAPTVIIKQDESDSNGVWSSYGSNKKLYITKNPWTLNTTEANIRAIADFVYNKLKASFGNASGYSYTPMKIDCLQDWSIVPGNMIKVNGVKTYVFSKRMNSSGVSFESTGDNGEEVMTVAQIESANNLNGKDIILTSYDYNNNASASLTIKGNDGSIYITTTGSGHVYVNGNILV